MFSICLEYNVHVQTYMYSLYTNEQWNDDDEDDENPKGVCCRSFL